MQSFIIEDKINTLLGQKADARRLEEILNKAQNLERLSLGETACLLNCDDPLNLEKIFNSAKKVKESIYGNRVVIFAPLYISNLCENECLYCAFRKNNPQIKRTFLTQEQIKAETISILKTGQKRILLVAGESYPKQGLRYIFDAIKTVYAAKDGQNTIRRLNVNIAPLSIDDFKELKKYNIGTFQTFQETYHLATYKKMHLSGPKADYTNRLFTMDRAINAGIDDVGIGALFGLYDYKFEVLSLLMHVEHLEKTFGIGPHTISVPRIEPATGSSIAQNPPFAVSDADFKKIIAVLRLSVPYTGIILSTRESEEMRKSALSLGVSQISAASRTDPGGYAASSNSQDGQFCLGDHRTLDEVVLDLCEQGFIPSFCTGCYRLGRTGHDFMDLAKPGEIKNKCLPNALLTFKEYMLDYASDKVKAIGNQLIDKNLVQITDPAVLDFTKRSLKDMEQGKRDIYC